MGKHSEKGKHREVKIDAKTALAEVNKRNAKIAAQQLKDKPAGIAKFSYVDEK